MTEFLADFSSPEAFAQSHEAHAAKLRASAARAADPETRDFIIGTAKLYEDIAADTREKIRAAAAVPPTEPGATTGPQRPTT